MSASIGQLQNKMSSLQVESWSRWGEGRGKSQAVDDQLFN